MRRTMLFAVTSLLIGFSFPSAIASAQVMKVAEDSLYSKVLNEQRVLHIMLPEDVSAAPTAKYDVLYVTDAEMFQHYVAQIIAFQQENHLVPQMIVVGIPNIWTNDKVTRERDLVPVHTDEYQTSGQSDRFLSFLAEELIPFINNKYPSNGRIRC